MDSELLEEMFLRVASPAPADLAHASAACVSFRRLIADHSFLHSTHPPLLLWLPTYPCRSACASSLPLLLSRFPSLAPPNWSRLGANVRMTASSGNYTA
ncbi:hypothetical protein BDA96_04G372100 [Sorghum bicolor]|uniref:F-box domain-containing protein n=1 Tax=Sorghum bicolor TaxID=4558 RepID=A0A921RAQ2_SORBI|nr:hypothetical protein BDA96_04G372100 [Sorghum bicolor]